jgi:hypothetical protein
LTLPLSAPLPFPTEPRSRRERFLALQQVYDLHLAPVHRLGDLARLQHDLRVVRVKQDLEHAWLGELEAGTAPRLAEHGALDHPETVVEALTDLAVRDRLPDAYHWLAKEADSAQVVDFLALEGGPDGGFDDLVAICQVGLSGPAKGELAKNYWDELGDGDPEQVHTTLHERLVAALDLLRVRPEDQLEAALERACLDGLLATNRWLQPEMVGALGMTELQAGPRCRMVLQALERVGAPDAALPFYRVHAEVDPVHGRDWVEKAVVPLVSAHPEWGPRIVRGACWRNETNLRFFAAAHAALARPVAA